MKIEMSDGIMEEVANGHELVEIGIPSGRIVHPTFAFVALNSFKLPHKSEMDPIIDSTNSLMGEYPSLQPSAKSINPVEWRGEGIQCRGEDFGSPSGKTSPETRHRKQGIQDNESE